MWRRAVRTTFCIPALSTLVLAQDPDIDASKFCVKFFGDISAEVLVGEGWRGRNHDGTVQCPDRWAFPSMRGAMMTLCPPSPDGSSDSSLSDSPSTPGLAMVATLEFHAITGTFARPIDFFRLANFPITNGSVPGPWDKEGGAPAVLAPQAQEPGQSGPEWTINGTEKALLPTTAGVPDLELYLNCTDLAPSQRDQYCGTREDTEAGGCWQGQWFGRFSGSAPVNFTVRFSSGEGSALVYVDAASKLGNGTDMGASTAIVRFEGGRELPSVVDYDFWRNSEADYEREAANINEMGFAPDHVGMPLFINRTQSREWYDTANGTFFVHDSGAGLRKGPDMGLLAISLVAVLGAGLLVAA